VTLAILGASVGCARAASTTDATRVETHDSAVVAEATPAGIAARPAPSAVAAAIAAGSRAGKRASTPVARPRATTAPTGPQILSVSATPSVIHAGQSVAWDVRTTSDIVSVSANVTAYHLPLQRTEPGHFVLNFTIPSNVPGFFHGTYSLDVRGETASGASADRYVSLVFE